MFSLVLLVWTETKPGLRVTVAALSVSTSEKHERCYILCRHIFHRISGNWRDHVLRIHTSSLYDTYLTSSGRSKYYHSKGGSQVALRVKASQDCCWCHVWNKFLTFRTYFKNQNQNQYQKSFNVPQKGKFVCCNSRILQEEIKSKTDKINKKEWKTTSLKLHTKHNVTCRRTFIQTTTKPPS